MPYFDLAELFDWDINQLKWLKKNNGFIQNNNQFESRFNIELILRIFDFFDAEELIKSIKSTSENGNATVYLTTIKDGKTHIVNYDKEITNKDDLHPRVKLLPSGDKYEESLFIPRRSVYMLFKWN